jgi:hypothetical protein
MKMQTTEFGRPTTSAGNDSWLEVVRQQVGSLRFGVVQIVVHEARVVQVERTEKVRFDQHSATATQRLTSHLEA